jgi:excisionase family DNA binding protein
VKGSTLPRFLTITEAADLLRINRNTAYEWALKHRLPGAFRVGGQWRVCRERLLGYVRENSVPSPGETER